MLHNVSDKRSELWKKKERAIDSRLQKKWMTSARKQLKYVASKMASKWRNLLSRYRNKHFLKAFARCFMLTSTLLKTSQPLWIDRTKNGKNVMREKFYLRQPTALPVKYGQPTAWNMQVWKKKNPPSGAIRRARWLEQPLYSIIKREEYNMFQYKVLNDKLSQFLIFSRRNVSRTKSYQYSHSLSLLIATKKKVSPASLMETSSPHLCSACPKVILLLSNPGIKFYRCTSNLHLYTNASMV